MTDQPPATSRTGLGPIRNLLAGTITKYAFLFVSIVTGILLMPFTMHHLGKSDYGLWMLVASMTAYFQLLDLGYGNGLVRQITQADVRGDEDGMNVVLSTFAVVYSGIGALALAGVAALTAFVVPLFPNLSADQIERAQWVVVILGLRVAIGFPMSVFGAVSTARQQFAITGSVAIAVAIVQAVATYVVLSAGYGLVPLVAATTSISLASYVAYAIIARRAFPAMRLSVARFSWAQVREVTSFSLYLFLISIAIQVSTNVNNLLVGAFMGTSALAVYAIAVRIAEYQRQLCGQFSQLMFPVVVRFHADENSAALRTTLVEGTRLAVGLACVVTVCVVAFGRGLIERWMGPGFDEAVAPLYVMTLAAVIQVGQGPVGSILLGAGRHRLVGIASCLDVIGSLALSLVLVRRFGLLGVAVGTAIPYALLNVGLLVPAACRIVRVPVGRLARTALRPALVASAAGALVAVLFRLLVPPGSLSLLMLEAAGVALVYLTGFWFAGLTSAERTYYWTSVCRLTASARQTRVAGVPTA